MYFLFGTTSYFSEMPWEGLASLVTCSLQATVRGGSQAGVLFPTLNPPPPHTPPHLPPPQIHRQRSGRAGDRSCGPRLPSLPSETPSGAVNDPESRCPTPMVSKCSRPLEGINPGPHFTSVSNDLLSSIFQMGRVRTRERPTYGQAEVVQVEQGLNVVRPAQFPALRHCHCTFPECI